MKQKLILFALLLTMGTVQLDAQPKHRHHATTTVKADTTAVAADANATDEGIEAFSDTTSIADDAQANYDDESVTTTTVSHNPDDYDDPISWLESFENVSLGFGGIMVAILVILVLLLFALAPFIILALVLRYMVRRHNDQVTLAEKAMETGQPIPEELMPVDKQSDEFLRSRGIRNIWIGIGLIVMFGFWDSAMLQGVGALVLCYGIGQMLIARSTKKKNQDLRDQNPEV
ncbi:MAG: DUF6249 domain-containing protein [Prevotella sp.]|nr:DUF6249 domain-containing protein [Prevotella sp.]